MTAPVRFLALQLRRIGDTILTAPALAALRRHYPNASITLVVDRPALEIARRIRADLEPVAFDRGQANLRLFAQVACTRFDTVLDFTGNDRSALLTLLARAPRRITFARHCRSPLRTRLYTHRPDIAVRDFHTIDYLLGLLKPLGVSEAPRTLPLAPDPAALAEADSRLAGTRDFFILHPGTARPEKYWLPDRWAAVANACSKRTGWTCLLTGTRDPHEQEQLARLRPLLRARVLDFSGSTSLPLLLALLAKARLLLGVDSAPMHLAAAVGTPQIALFGPTNPFHWRPLDPRAITLQAGNPGSDFTDPRRPGRPMQELQTESVLAALETLLATLHPQPPAAATGDR